jgi:hypothetical protein
MTEHVSTFLAVVGGGLVLVLLILEIRHTDRFGKDTGPMPVRTRNFLMWMILIWVTALTAWELRRGNTFFYH